MLQFDFKTMLSVSVALTWVFAMVLLVSRKQQDAKAVSRWAIGSLWLSIGLLLWLIKESYFFSANGAGFTATLPSAIAHYFNAFPPAVLTLLGFVCICFGLIVYINGIRTLKGQREFRFIPALILITLLLANALMFHFKVDSKLVVIFNVLVLLFVLVLGMRSLTPKQLNFVGNVYWLCVSMFGAVILVLLVRLFNWVFMQQTQAGESLVGQSLASNTNSYLLLFVVLTMTAVTMLLMLVMNVNTHKRLASMATQDALTEVLNRRGLNESAQKIRAICQRIQMPLSLLIVDLDYFKKVNDVYGHLVGDVVLKACAKTIKSALRGGDLLGRYGGEEFCIILPNTPEADAAGLAERIRKMIESTPVSIAGVDSMGMDNTAIKCSVSIGVVGSETVGYAVEGLFASADQALYAAKQNGRNRVETYVNLQKKSFWNDNLSDVDLELPSLKPI